MKASRTAFRKVWDKAFVSIVLLLSILSIVPLFLIFFHIFKEGFSSITPGFFVNLPKPVGEPGGGIANALVGSGLLVLVACILALPVGIAVGVFLAEARTNLFSTSVRLSMEVLQGMPSIVIGIIAYLWVVKPMGTFSALSGSVALAIMMLPVIVRTTEETLRLVPRSLKEVSLALGAPYYLTVLRVVLPAGISGIVTGILISVARIAGETAPLLFTAFGNPFMNTNLLKPVNSLPLIIFNYAISPYDDWHALAWGASFVLIVLVLALNLLSKVISHRFRVEF
ncbi:MAG: phosphate ABC transporter permease PstA [Chitinivibrionales bacterium]|nr:phosphate ABC transporter permease PstA [Chitinivibrionales bacterium]MBD3394117.1 phosphate ABC transporter permease PstA [Chitinivibrionales bacterium]